MALIPGTRLGPYEIVSALGAGGMGEVYRARDTGLDRDVAIKILPETFTADAERIARFQREAKVLASLNHPNIAIIHNLEHADGAHALVMELVEGEDLAQRIGRGAIPLDEALPIATQIAEALEAAHEQGIIHRDLKPANIKLRHDGTVKVLDFGLAKAMDPVGSAPNVSQSPTITTPAMTQAGIILGTAAYMSPEQTRGKPVDRRADIWAFGTVLYEMLSGQRAFEGDDIADTLAAVLRADPRWAELPPHTPQAMVRLLRRCLQKDPKLRLQHIGDARLELADVVQRGSDDPVAVSVPARGRIWPLVVLVAVGAAVVGGIVWQRLAPQPVAGPVKRFAIQVPTSAPLAARGGGLALSPDGRTLVYAASGTSPGLMTRQLDDLSLVPLRGAEGGTWPFFSPDGAWVGFFADGKLKKVPAVGGPAVALCDAPPNARATWGDDDTIVVARTHLYKVAASGGTLDVIFEAESGGEQFSQPEFLPGSHVVLVRTRMPPGEGRLEAVDLQNRTRHALIEGATPKLAATGDLLFVQQGGIWATRLDARRLAVVGTPVPLIESVGSFDGEALFAASRDGSLAYVPGAGEPMASIVWRDRTGKSTPALDDKGAFLYPRLSPDGERVAVSVTKGSVLDVWAFEFTGGSRLRLTTDGINRRSVWSPDGTQIAFYSQPATPEQGVDQDLYVMPSTGGKPTRLLARPGLQWPDAWSPNGSSLVFEDGRGPSRDLWLLSFGEEPRPLVVTRFNERGAVFSPNGRWLAFVSDESGRPEVYVQPFPGPGPKVPISNNGGLQPIWAKNGRDTFYREGDSLMAVPVQLDPFRVTARHKLFDLPGAIYGVDQFVAEYDVAADGRFLAVRRDSRAVEAIHVVLNWTEELRRALGR